MEKDKSCIIVGNAQMTDSMGSKIDSYDEVVRINRFETKGFEDIVGTKCTTWILNNKLSWREGYYKNNRNDIFNTHKNIKCLVLTYTNRGERTLKQYKREHSNFDYIIKENVYDWKSTTGLLAIEHFIEQYGHVTIVGFDFGKTHHYWGNKSRADSPDEKHGWDKEKEYVNRLFRNGKVSYLERF